MMTVGAFYPLPVFIHMSQGLMFLALALCIFLLPCMGLSFWSVFHRLNKIDAVFSSLSTSIGKCWLGPGVPRPPAEPPHPWRQGIQASLLQSVSPGLAVSPRSLPLLLCLSLSSQRQSVCMGSLSHFLFISLLCRYLSVCHVCVCVRFSARHGGWERMSVFSYWASRGHCPASCPSLAPPQCRVPASCQLDALCSQL